MSDDIRARIIAEARARLGVPYELPPNPPESTDCSLYVRDVYEAAGLPFSPGVRVAEQERQDTIMIGWDEVLPGDLLIFTGTYDAGTRPDGEPNASHIGISLGAGSHRMLNALEPVSAETRIDTAYWQNHIVEARRHPALMNATVPVGTFIRGIDVSSNNPHPIDWQAVAASGIAFAMIKVTEDDSYANPFFEQDWKGAKQAGLVRGAYHFAQPEGNDAVEEANWMLDHIEAHGGLMTGDLLALDMESGSGNLGPWTLECLKSLEKRSGVKSLVYTGKWFADPHNLGSTPELKSYPLWLAQYNDAPLNVPAPWSQSDVVIHQYTDALTVPGIKAPVDGNRCLVTMEQLKALGKGGSVPPGPTPYSVGDGVLALMASHGDVPGSDELYNPFWSETMAKSGAIYRWLKVNGQTFRYPPVP